MHHLILGYGYCGYHLAQELLANQQKVTAVSRHLKSSMILSGLNHLSCDLSHPFKWTEPDTIIYYLIPPPNEGTQDLFLKKFLNQSVIQGKKILYFGSSGVYGNHHGAWVDENASCFIKNNRQKRRLDAEQQCLAFCDKHKIEAVILRIAGIYGPQRLPVEAAKAMIPVIEKDTAPYTNHIFVKDLASIARKIGQNPTPYSLYNIADGHPAPMGTLQQLVAKVLQINLAPYESLEEAWERASPIKREFIQGSKRLNVDRLKRIHNLTPLKDAVIQSL